MKKIYNVNCWKYHFFNFAAKRKVGFGDTEFIYSKNICDNNAYITTYM